VTKYPPLCAEILRTSGIVGTPTLLAFGLVISCLVLTLGILAR